MRNSFKAIWAVSVILWHIVQGIVMGKLIRDPVKRRAFYLNSVHRHALWAAKALNLEIEFHGRENMRPGQNYFIVANHMSYLDAILLGTVAPTAFVSSVEMRNTPVLGTVMVTGGCLFVERRSKNNIQGEIGQIEEALKQGFNVGIFPEATSTDGAAVKQFKRPLYTAAVRAKVPVLPLVIQYESLDGVPVTAANRDALCWYGDMGFAPHFFGLMRFRRVKVGITFLPEIPVTASDTRDTLMDQSYAKISGHYRPIV